MLWDVLPSASLLCTGKALPRHDGQELHLLITPQLKVGVGKRAQTTRTGSVVLPTLWENNLHATNAPPTHDLALSLPPCVSSLTPKPHSLSSYSLIHSKNTDLHHCLFPDSSDFHPDSYAFPGMPLPNDLVQPFPQGCPVSTCPLLVP